MSHKSKEISASSALIPASEHLKIAKKGHTLSRAWYLTHFLPGRREKLIERGGDVAALITDAVDILSPIPLDPINWALESVKNAREVRQARSDRSEDRRRPNHNLPNHHWNSHNRLPDLWERRGEVALLATAAHNPEMLQRLFPDQKMQEHVRHMVTVIENDIIEGKGIGAIPVSVLLDRPIDPLTNAPLEEYQPQAIEQVLEKDLAHPEFAKEKQIVVENAAALARHTYEQEDRHLLEREKVDKIANVLGYSKLALKAAVRATPFAGYFFIRPHIIQFLVDHDLTQVATFLNHPKLLAGVIAFGIVSEVSVFISGILHNAQRRGAIREIDRERGQLGRHIRNDFEQVLANFPGFEDAHPEVLASVTPTRKH